MGIALRMIYFKAHIRECGVHASQSLWPSDGINAQWLQTV
jgi:hypothetical protein